MDSCNYQECEDCPSGSYRKNCDGTSSGECEDCICPDGYAPQNCGGMSKGTCEEKSCTSVPVIESSIHFEEGSVPNNSCDGTNSGETCDIQCKPGYRRNSVNLTCSKGLWNDADVKCVEIDECAEVAACHSDATCEDQINGYICHCPADRHGTHCRSAHNDCPDPSDTDAFFELCGHASSCENKNRVSHDTASYLCHCKDGYKKPAGAMECTKVIRCPAIVQTQVQPITATASCSGKSVFDSDLECEFKCAPGYDFSPRDSKTSTCQIDGTWSTYPICALSPCRFGCPATHYQDGEICYGDPNHFFPCEKCLTLDDCEKGQYLEGKCGGTNPSNRKSKTSCATCKTSHNVAGNNCHEGYYKMPGTCDSNTETFLCAACLDDRDCEDDFWLGGEPCSGTLQEDTRKCMQCSNTPCPLGHYRDSGQACNHVTKGYNCLPYECDEETYHCAQCIDQTMRTWNGQCNECVEGYFLGSDNLCREYECPGPQGGDDCLVIPDRSNHTEVFDSCNPGYKLIEKQCVAFSCETTETGNGCSTCEFPLERREQDNACSSCHDGTFFFFFFSYFSHFFFILLSFLLTAYLPFLQDII